MRDRWGRRICFVAIVALTGSFGFGAVAGPDAGPQSRANTGAFRQLAQATPNLRTLTREGRLLYARECSVCHGDEGEGIAGPKLVGNELLESRGLTVGQILWGDPERGMPPFDALNNRQAAAVATFVRNAWGNEFGVVLPDYVDRLR